MRVKPLVAIVTSLAIAGVSAALGASARGRMPPSEPIKMLLANNEVRRSTDARLVGRPTLLTVQASPVGGSASISPAETAIAVELCNSPKACSSPSTFDPPPGQRLVIEAASGWCWPNSLVALSGRLNGRFNTHFFAALGSLSQGYMFHVLTRVYMDDTLSLITSNNNALCGVTLSGHLIAMP
jgi:hypothetical protein